MDTNLRGRRAVVTGASRGIGGCIAERLAQQGAAVGLIARDAEAIAERLEYITAEGGRAVMAPADLGNAASRHAGFTAARDALGGVDIFVHAAAAYPAGYLLDTPPSQFAAMYETNVIPFVVAAGMFAPDMMSAGFGRFVAITDIAALMPLPGSAAYTLSKAALLHAAKLLSKELAGSVVTANAVSPGLTRTPGSEALFGQVAEGNGWPTNWDDLEPLLLEHVLPVPVGRAARPEDIAHAVTFLCSDPACYISGAHLTVDGGAQPSIA